MPTSETAPATTPALASHSQRDPLLDTARALLIVLVVVGHLLARVRGSDAADALYAWIYAFHMPAFVFISGFLAQRFRATPKECVGLTATLLAPYLVFQVIGFAAKRISGQPVAFTVMDPAFALWFLLALCAWRLLVPVLRSVRFSVPIAVAVSLLAPLAAGVGDALALNRVLSFLPFFALGVALTPERLERLRHRWSGSMSRVAAGVLLVTAACGAYLLRDVVPRSVLQMDSTYGASGFGAIDGMLWRLVHLAVAVALTAAFLIVLPRDRTPVTWLGTVTLYVYLLHSVIVRELMPIISSTDFSIGGVLGLVVAGIALSLLLGSRPVRLLTRPPVEPPVARLLARGDRQSLRA